MKDVVEGVLAVEFVKYHKPNDCVCGCDPNKSWKPRQIWRVEDGNHCVFSPHFDDIIKHLDGKRVRITVELLEENPPIK